MMKMGINSALAFLVSLVWAQSTTAASTIRLSSSAFSPGGKVPPQFTCQGANINPQLKFQGIPTAAKSLALVIEDPDAPSGLFTHWLVWNISPGTAEIAEKSEPAGAVQGTNDFGEIGYGGPSPPSGTHRYFFRVIALDQMLGLRSGAKRAEFDKAIAGHVLATGELMGRFSR